MIIIFENLLSNKSLVSLQHLLFYSNRSCFLGQMKKMFHLNKRNISYYCHITLFFFVFFNCAMSLIMQSHNFIQIEYQYNVFLQVKSIHIEKYPKYCQEMQIINIVFW